MSKKVSLEELKLEISIKAKKGIDFVLSASLIWGLNFFIWHLLKNTAYEKSVFTFMTSAILLPLAILFSKIFKTEWKIKDNLLQPLGLWLNFAQLLYFPFLIFTLIKCPDYFIMTYAIITGAHLFPYAWFYNEIAYAIIGGLISLGALLIALYLGVAHISYIPFYTFILLLILALKLYFSVKNIKIKLTFSTSKEKMKE